MVDAHQEFVLAQVRFTWGRQVEPVHVPAAAALGGDDGRRDGAEERGLERVEAVSDYMRSIKDILHLDGFFYAMQSVVCLKTGCYFPFLCILVLTLDTRGAKSYPYKDERCGSLLFLLGTEQNTMNYAVTVPAFCLFF